MNKPPPTATERRLAATWQDPELMIDGEVNPLFVDALREYAIEAAYPLVAALRLSNHRLHPADERGPCLCFQCDFVRARDKALEGYVKGHS